MAIPKTLLNFESSLAVKISSSASALTLLDSTDDNGTTLSGAYYLTIDEGTNIEEHMIVTLTGASGAIGTRGLSRSDAKTNVAGNQYAHSRGASVKMTNVALVRLIQRLNGDEAFDSPAWTGVASIAGLSTPTSGETTKAANVAYVNAVAVAGAPDATTTVKGIAEEATQTEIDNDTAAGSAARLFVNPSTLATSKYGTRLPSADQKAALAGTSGTPSATNKYITAEDAATTPTASEIPRADSNGRITSWERGFVLSFTSGEAMTGATTPRPVFLKKSDGKIYLSDANDIDRLDFIGFAVSTTTGADQSVSVQIGGVVRGLSGLTAGTNYWVQNNNDIASASGTYPIYVGRAVSTTELLIIKDVFNSAELSVGANEALNRRYANFILSEFSDTTNMWAITRASVEAKHGSARLAATDVNWSYITGADSIIDIGTAANQELKFGSSKKVIVDYEMIHSGTTGQGGHGLVQSATPLNDYDDQTVDAACFTYNGANLYAHTSNAGAGHTETQINSVTLTNKNRFRIEFNPGVDVRFYVNGSLAATVTTNLPATNNISFGVGNSDNGTGMLLRVPAVSVQI